MTFLLQVQDPLNAMRDARYRALHEAFNQDASNTGWSILVVVILIIAIPISLLIAAAIQRRLRNEPTRRPRALLWKLGRHASLSRLDRMFLLRTARHCGLTDPAAVVLSESAFDRLVEIWQQQGGATTRLAAIRRQLFGQSAPSDATEPMQQK
jgi:hypothetical protein